MIISKSMKACPGLADLFQQSILYQYFFWTRKRSMPGGQQRQFDGQLNDDSRVEVLVFRKSQNYKQKTICGGAVIIHTDAQSHYGNTTLSNFRQIDDQSLSETMRRSYPWHIRFAIRSSNRKDRGPGNILHYLNAAAFLVRSAEIFCK
jgi:hypothetical protein